jgi:hypothetical protein
MVFVVLKTGKVIQYNDGNRITEDGLSYVITPTGRATLIARIPVANVERIEFGRPCRILSAKKLPKARRDIYET